MAQPFVQRNMNLHGRKVFQPISACLLGHCSASTAPFAGRLTPNPQRRCGLHNRARPATVRRDIDRLYVLSDHLC